MSTYIALNGSIRLYDSTDDKRLEANGDVQIFDDSLASWTDKTSEAFSDAASVTGGFMVATADRIYIGQTAQFARINVDVSTAGVGTGTLIAKYYNGSTWASLTVTDGTDDGTDTMAQDGVISFSIPSDWAVKGNANLDADKYYIELAATSVPGTPPDAEQIWPVDGQYFALCFDGGDLTAPEGRPRPEETPVFCRGRATTGTVHHISGDDTPILEPLELSFTCKLDNTINKTALVAALQCLNPNYDTNWDATGVSTKQDTTLTNGDGTTFTTPPFADSSKKAICVQIVWTRDSVSIGRAYHEVYIAPDQISIAEAEDGVVLSITAQIYGAIQTIYAFGYQY